MARYVAGEVFCFRRCFQSYFHFVSPSDLYLKNYKGFDNFVPEKVKAVCCGQVYGAGELSTISALFSVIIPFILCLPWTVCDVLVLYLWNYKGFDNLCRR